MESNMYKNDADKKNYHKQYHIDNKEELNERSRKWAKDNKEHKLEYQKQYRKNNKDLIEKQSKRYYIDNRIHINEQSKWWEIHNKDKRRVLNIKRRAMKCNQTPKLTEQEIMKIKLYGQIAQYLGKDWHIDHIHPISKGGLHHPDNLQILTKDANLQKNNKLDFIPEPLEYFRI